MPVPVIGERVSKSLRQILKRLPTFQKLTGTIGDLSATDAFIHDRYSLDTFDPAVDQASPNRQPEDAFPRLTIEDAMPQIVDVQSYGISGGHGKLGLLLEIKEFTAAELSSWYSTSITNPTERDHLCHVDNIKIAICNEMSQLQSTNPDGDACLKITQIVEDTFGLVDPAKNQDLRIWIVCYQINWEGLP